MRRRRAGARPAVIGGVVGALVASALAVAGPAYAGGPATGPGHAAGRAPSAGGPATSLQRAFAAASREFHVPDSVLLAVAYHETRWDAHGGRPSTTGNYNVMGLTQVQPSAVGTASQAERRAELDLRGEGSGAFHPDAAALAAVDTVHASDPSLHTLDTAAGLIHRPAADLRTDPAQSVRGGAALLASYERAATGSLPADPAGWYAAVARFSGSPDTAGAREFADRVYTTVTTGASRTTDDGQTVTLAAQPASAAPRATARTAALATLGLPADAAPSTDTATPTPECPSSLSCDFVPAAYASTSSSDKTAYGNYDMANRPADGDAIQDIVIHDTESSYSATLQEFQNPSAAASAHYLIRASDGHVTQLVQDKDIAWHAGNKSLNAHSLGIEHEGYAISGADWYNESQYESSAALVRYLADRYGIPLDRQHILGHDDIPGPLDSYVASMHWDPGTYWDWSHYMALLGAPLGGGGTPVVGGEITIAPPFTSANEPTVTGCPGTCPAQPANFVYLRTSPSATAPLITDTLVSSTGGTAGSTAADDWTDKAVAGQTFVVAAVQGDWTAIWYEGQKAWFSNPDGQNAKANSNAAQTLITPAGSTAIPVYGRNYPEASAYPTDLADVAQEANQLVTPLSYTIPAGQVYTAADPVPGDFFYAENYDESAVGDHTLVVGTTQYYPIRYNHRIAYVKASDVRTVDPVQPPSGLFVPTGPTRLLDTRNGTGGHTGAVGPAATIALQVTGANGIPATGVTAAVLNVTAVSPTATSHVIVYPDGQPRPGTSNLNFTAGTTVPNLVVVPVVDGKVDFYNSAGSVHLLADVTGYYTSSGNGSLFTSAGPTRVMDTRNGTGGVTGPVGADTSVSLQLAGTNGIPATGVTAAVLNVTAVSPTATSHVIVYPDGQARPGTSSLNFPAGATIANLVVVPVVNGKVDFYNYTGSVQLLADITGYYTSSGTGAAFHTAGPTRVLDTRDGTGGVHAALGASGTATVTVEGRSGLPATGVTAVVLNVTATSATAQSHLVVYPDGQARPGTSSVNFPAGRTTPNLVVVPVVNGKIDIWNYTGSVQVFADISGWFGS